SVFPSLSQSQELTFSTACMLKWKSSASLTKWRRLEETPFHWKGRTIRSNATPSTAPVSSVKPSAMTAPRSSQLFSARGAAATAVNWRDGEGQGDFGPVFLSLMTFHLLPFVYIVLNVP